ncbi:hypothetical protein DERP_005943 [Dermatophagoides pteronyssinus]|uniref:Uncharacterized protein n=1 Tax=Dermatophagoides pteronyssinus TaxID=6956 RepID=A0ABQ8JRV4_DERPT|nr:hypothetical protein DERP_005943 [Dermatophagoides pteronyssinus]
MQINGRLIQILSMTLTNKKIIRSVDPEYSIRLCANKHNIDPSCPLRSRINSPVITSQFLITESAPAV